MKNSLFLFLLTLFLTISISKADDYVWGEEFKEGDIISAATFNQIFSTLEKINRVVKDADLVGTWSCDAASAEGSGISNSGVTLKSFFYLNENAQLTITASSATTSLERAYSFSTSAPTPLVFLSTSDGVKAQSGTYILYKNIIMVKGHPNNANQVTAYEVNFLSNDQFTLEQKSNIGGNTPAFIICDSAVAVPAAPTATIATNAQTLVNVTWTDQSSDETGFKIYRRLSAETEATQLATAVTASPYVDSTLTEGQTAYYSVSAYNANGESAKSRVVAATLDSVKPTVVSHVPSANQQVDPGVRSHQNLSITFSEAVKIICPAGGNGPSCSTAGFAITAVGTKDNDELSNYNYEFPVSGSPFASAIAVGESGIVFSGDLTPMNLPSGDTITVTVHKEWIQDANGNPMDADYSYTFTTGS